MILFSIIVGATTAFLFLITLLYLFAGILVLVELMEYTFNHGLATIITTLSAITVICFFYVLGKFVINLF